MEKEVKYTMIKAVQITIQTLKSQYLSTLNIKCLYSAMACSLLPLL